MAKKAQFIIFGDQSWPVESLARALPGEIPVAAWIDGKGWILESPSAAEASLVAPTPVLAVASRRPPVVRALLAAQNCELPANQHLEAVAIVGFQNPEISHKVVECLKARSHGIKILEVGSPPRPAGRPVVAKPLKRSVAWQDIMSSGMEQEIQLLTLQHRVEDLREALKDAPEVAILLQDDPDPDGLASALALRKILGRKSQTAPILTFGRITRPENVAMSRLLDIEVQTVTPEQLAQYARVALVDCQPSFFKGRRIRADVILDHHPRIPPAPGQPQEETRELGPYLFEEVREDFGALSTLMTLFLRAAHIDISQRIATALLYGIKSDTLLLNRQSSEMDLEAFVYLYPKINTNMLRKIERPELPLVYLDRLRRGLKGLQVQDGIAVIPLGTVDREEWIAQAADFALQVEGAQWSFGVGVVEGRVVISGRNCGYVQHCGDVFKKLFDGVGCAGGHRTMAKAMIPLAQWKKRFGARSLSAQALAELLARELHRELASSARTH